MNYYDWEKGNFFNNDNFSSNWNSWLNFSELHSSLGDSTRLNPKNQKIINNQNFTEYLRFRLKLIIQMKKTSLKNENFLKKEYLTNFFRITV